MNAMFDPLEFADSFERAGFDHEKARALASAFNKAHGAARDELVTKEHLDLRLGEFEARMDVRVAGFSSGFQTSLADLELRLAKQIADNGKDISGRLWSTITIIAGVSTAISAVIGAGVALLLKSGGL